MSHRTSRACWDRRKRYADPGQCSQRYAHARVDKWQNQPECAAGFRFTGPVRVVHKNKCVRFCLRLNGSLHCRRAAGRFGKTVFSSLVKRQVLKSASRRRRFARSKERPVFPNAPEDRFPPVGIEYFQYIEHLYSVPNNPPKAALRSRDASQRTIPHVGDQCVLTDFFRHRTVKSVLRVS